MPLKITTVYNALLTNLDIIGNVLFTNVFNIGGFLCSRGWYRLFWEAIAFMETYHIVFIDDEEFMTEIFNHFVARKYPNWLCKSFNDPGSVLKDIQDQSLAAKVWILDLMMPDVSGAQLAEAIRANYNCENTLIIAYTALEHSELLRHVDFTNQVHLFDWIINKRTMLSDVLAQVQPVLDQVEPLN